MKKPFPVDEALRREALEYHAVPTPGKLFTALSKPCDNQKELSLAYTPGVAAPVMAIAEEPELAYRYTAKGNLVAVISDGSAVLGLGRVGPLASKPVMEGKAVLFKRFADIDVFDIEVQADSVDAFVETVVNISPTFGGINLEDIAAPACFEIEGRLQQRLDIPVFHDDQHGTAVIVAAGLLNALELQQKRLSDCRIVCLGAGSAAIASMELLLEMGVTREQIVMIDRQGVIHSGRSDVNEYKRRFSVTTPLRSLSDAMAGADVLIGVAGADTVSCEMVAMMAARPVIFALSNPRPEILPESAHAVRSDLIMATGRSDYPNQVNNVLGFPFIFRGALDVRARCINSEMKLAAVEALAQLTREEVPETVLQAYGVGKLCFDRDYILPKPFDPRLKQRVSAAVARAAVESSVARLALPERYAQGVAPSSSKRRTSS
ncbi:MAG: malate dehydrogenase [Chromatiales bacterium]|nr:malate dehydrogenase [Chromatiales bacterium]